MEFDTLCFKIYSAIMSFKLIAASFVVIYLLLVGVEFSEDIGFIKSSKLDPGKSIETAIVNFGTAIQALGDSQITMSPNLSVHSEVIPASPNPSLSIERVSYHLRKEAEFLKAHFRIHKFQQVFLI